MNKLTIAGIVIVTIAATATVTHAVNPPEPVRRWSPGNVQAANSLFGPRSGWTWGNPPEPLRGIDGRLVPVAGTVQTIDVDHTDGDVRPCIRVVVAADERGEATFRLLIDTTMLDHLAVEDLDGTPLRVEPVVRGE